MFFQIHFSRKETLITGNICPSPRNGPSGDVHPAQLPQAGSNPLALITEMSTGLPRKPLWTAQNFFFFFPNKSNYFPVNLDAAGSPSLLSSAFRQGAAGCCWLVSLPSCSQRFWTSSQLEVGKKILQVSTVLPVVRFSRLSSLLRASLHHRTWARMGSTMEPGSATPLGHN